MVDRSLLQPRQLGHDRPCVEGPISVIWALKMRTAPANLLKLGRSIVLIDLGGVL